MKILIARVGYYAFASQTRARNIYFSLLQNDFSKWEIGR